METLSETPLGLQKLVGSSQVPREAVLYLFETAHYILRRAMLGSMADGQEE